MARYNGIDLGIVEEMTTNPNPKDRQVNAYPGIPGLEVIDLGARGGRTFLRGVFAGTNFADLASIQAVMNALQLDGGAYPLLDAKGSLWTGVILEQFRPVGRMYALFNGVAQRYEAEFLHIGS